MVAPFSKTSPLLKQFDVGNRQIGHNDGHIRESNAISSLISGVSNKVDGDVDELIVVTEEM